MDLDDVLDRTGNDETDQCQMLIDIALDTAREECGEDAYERSVQRVVNERQDNDTVMGELLGIMRDHTFPPGYARPRRDCDSLLLELGAVGQEAQAAAQDTFGGSGGDWAISGEENRLEFARAVEAAGQSIMDDMSLANCVTDSDMDEIDAAVSGLADGIRDEDMRSVESHTDTLEDFADV